MPSGLLPRKLGIILAAVAATAAAYLVLTAETEQTHYDVLHVDQKADLSAIKRAYRSRALVLHPDKVQELGPVSR